MASQDQVVAQGQVKGMISGKKYSLKRFLAGGGCGEVYLAEREDGQNFAIKCCRGGITKNILEREANTLRNIEESGGHRNVIHLEEFGRFSPSPLRDQLCFVMDKCDITLRDLFNGPAMTELALTEVCFQAFSGLGFVHSCGIAHKDLGNPANTLLKCDGKRARVVLADFGCATKIAPEQHYQLDLDTRRLAVVLLNLIRRRTLGDPTTVDPPNPMPKLEDWSFLHSVCGIPPSHKDEFDKAIRLVCCVSNLPGLNEYELRQKITQNRNWWTEYIANNPRQAVYIDLVLKELSKRPGTNGIAFSADLCSILAEALGFADENRKQSSAIALRLEMLPNSRKRSMRRLLLEHMTQYFA